MKRTGKLQWRKRLCKGAAVVFAAMVLWLAADIFSIVSRADSQGRVTATSAKVRSEASTSSTSVASAFKDDVVTITGQVQGGDGYTWYAITTSKNVTGYIRSDLIQLIDGSTPPAQTSPPETQAQVTEVNPISATITGNASVRVRSNASTNSNILTTVSNGTVVTVTGQATGADNKLWYYVTFISNNTEVTGFVRSDFAKLSGELVPVTQNPTPETTPEPQPPESTPEPAPAKAYDTVQRDDGWWVYDTATESGWNIDKLVNGAKTNGELYEQSQKTVKSQKVVIVILVFLLVAAGAGAAFLVFKMKEMSDSAYFNAVESETLRRRSEAPQGNRQRVMQTVGTEKQSAKPAGAATQGQRPAGAATQGQRPAGAATQGQRPAGSAPQGQRPAGSAPQGQRPAGSAPQGQRPAGAAPQGQRPAGSAPQGQRPAGSAPQGQRPAGSAPQGQKPAQKQGWQAKNFMADDEEEFDFEFLNGDEEKK